MRVTIWDLDYYYAKNRTNCFNPDAMKISSYHKQLGDKVNFVVKEDDIRRPYDLYYIIKEKQETPNAPLDFYLNTKVRWWGKAFKRKINWQMNNAMLACRPDYLLYPEKETALERAEHVRLLNDRGELLPLIQDWRNAFKNKKVIETDTALWTTSRKNLLLVLDKLSNILNLSFFEPIWLPKINSDEEIMNKFLKLHFLQGAVINFVPILAKDYEACAKTWKRIKKTWPHIKIGPLVIKQNTVEHWRNKEKAIKDFNDLKTICTKAKKDKIPLRIQPLKERLDTPFFFPFEVLSHWTDKGWSYSWLEWITIEYGSGMNSAKMKDYWQHPAEWSAGFRDLLSQTYQRSNAEFLTAQWGERQLSLNDIPWTIWEHEFKFGI